MLPQLQFDKYRQFCFKKSGEFLHAEDVALPLCLVSNRIPRFRRLHSLHGRTVLAIVGEGSIPNIENTCKNSFTRFH